VIGGDFGPTSLLDEKSAEAPTRRTSPAALEQLADCNIAILHVGFHT